MRTIPPTERPVVSVESICQASNREWQAWLVDELLQQWWPGVKVQAAVVENGEIRVSFTCPWCHSDVWWRSKDDEMAFDTEEDRLAWLRYEAELRQSRMLH